jgi:hypothetical protein
VEFVDGELHKTPETYLDVVSKLLEAKVDRKTLVIGLGGGVTTDIVGFACATVLVSFAFQVSLNADIICWCLVRESPCCCMPSLLSYLIALSSCDFISIPLMCIFAISGPV